MKCKLLLSMLLCILISTGIKTRASTIGWGAQSNNSFASASGIPLAVGDVVKLGYFNVSDSAITSTIQAGGNVYTNLNSNFIQWDVDAAIGDGSLPDGFFGATSTVTNPPAGLINQQIYMWVFNSTNPSTATEMGIFYMNKSLLTLWTFPGSPTEGTSVDITQLTSGASGNAPLALGATIVWGSFDTKNTNFGFPQFDTAAVPEPSSIALLLLSGLNLGLLKYRRSNR